MGQMDTGIVKELVNEIKKTCLIIQKDKKFISRQMPCTMEWALSLNKGIRC